jgi:hypothetical protein
MANDLRKESERFCRFDSRNACNRRESPVEQFDPSGHHRSVRVVPVCPRWAVVRLESVIHIRWRRKGAISMGGFIGSLWFYLIMIPIFIGLIVLLIYMQKKKREE